MKKIHLIAAVLVMGLLAGCKTVTPEQAIAKECDENRTAIEKHIQDPDRQAALLAVIDDFEADIIVIAADSVDARKRYSAALQTYDTPEEELVRLQKEVASCLDRLCLAAKTHSMELRETCSEEEWEQLTAHYHKLKNVTYL